MVDPQDLKDTSDGGGWNKFGNTEFDAKDQEIAMLKEQNESLKDSNSSLKYVI